MLIAWENEACLLKKEFGAKFDVVAVVDKNVDKQGTRVVAEEYLRYLYTEAGQDIAGKNCYRPAVSEKAILKYAKQFAKIKLFTIGVATEALGDCRQLITLPCYRWARRATAVCASCTPPIS